MNLDTHVIIDHEGEIKAKYRKLHLFDVQLAGSVKLLYDKLLGRS